jgi:hypothetical protein
MTAAAETASVERTDARTIVVSGVKLGIITTVGVAGFAALSRVMDGTVETVVQSVLLLVGGVVFAFLPAVWTRPRTGDGIAWASLVGLLGALVFTVFDTALLRPLGLYHWTWDQIGGGSGFWYVPVWWMGSTFLAWLGSWVWAASAARGEPSLGRVAGVTVAIGLALFGLLAVTIAPPTSAVMALAFTLALVVCVPVAVVRARR